MTQVTQTKYYTLDGLNRLKSELEHLMKVERPGISQAIAEARDKGDLSENAEYDAAKNAQGLLEGRIIRLQDTIRNARIIDESKLDSSKVLILSTVMIKNLINNSVQTYTLVPENEADIRNGKISVSSPIAQGLLGKVIGEHVEVTVPAGKIPFEIVSITRQI